MNKVFLGIGTNLGDRAANIKKAYQLIEKYMGQITLQSSCYETAPWGVLDQPNFINSCIAIETDLSPIVLLNKITLIEKEIVMSVNKFFSVPCTSFVKYFLIL